jgi:cytochrome c-type biogenesis protein CcmE
MKRKYRRLWILVACGVGVGSASALALTALSSDLVYYLSPSQIAVKHPSTGRTFRLGGLVEAGSLRRTVIDGRPCSTFKVTDLRGDVTVSYIGILPDLFREGQGVVTMGHMLSNGQFKATEVLAKHDESYMPKDVAEALKASGQWHPAQGPPPPAATWNMLDPATVAKPKPLGSS